MYTVVYQLKLYWVFHSRFAHFLGLLDARKCSENLSVPDMYGTGKELSNSTDEHVPLHAHICASTKAEHL